MKRALNKARVAMANLQRELFSLPTAEMVALVLMGRHRVDLAEPLWDGLRVLLLNMDADDLARLASGRAAIVFRVDMGWLLTAHVSEVQPCPEHLVLRKAWGDLGSFCRAVGIPIVPGLAGEGEPDTEVWPEADAATIRRTFEASPRWKEEFCFWLLRDDVISRLLDEIDQMEVVEALGWDPWRDDVQEADR